MKITFIGAGSAVFVKNVLGDCILTPEFGEFEIALHDIDAERLSESEKMMNNINRNCKGKARITATLNRREALRGANFVVNAIQVGGYKPSTVIDFEIPKKYGLRQTIGDTLGIGGIFRALRTIPAIAEIAHDIEEVCPEALFLNYTNPMAMLSGYLHRYTGVKAVGLCHSVQACVPGLFRTLDMQEYTDNCKWEIAGINHQAWLLSISDKDGNDLYPEIKKRSLSGKYEEKKAWDLVRHEMMHRFGYYITESSEHTSEYVPWFIKDKYPELIERFKIPLDEYLRRCEEKIAEWDKIQRDLLHNEITHDLSEEYAMPIIRAAYLDQPIRIHGNVLNTGLITNLPNNACVEVPCLIDRNGINPCYVGDLPEQCAAVNRTNINPQLLTIEAAVTLRREYIYMAAMLDPHTAAELSMDDIKNMCDELIEAHGSYLPRYH